MNTKRAALKPSDTAIVLVDHQPGVMAMVKSLPAQVVTANAATLARLGEEMGIPLVITSTRENLERLGTTLKPIQDAAPQAYKQRIRRAGSLNAFRDKAFADRVSSIGRPNLVIAGIVTDVCLYHSAVSAVEAGYQVYVVADACGTSSTLADEVTYQRLQELDVVVTTTYGVLFELYSDLSTPDGQRAEGVAVASLAAAA